MLFPARSAYFPGVHAVHADELEAETDPSVQFWQVEDACAAEWLPAAQGRQVVVAPVASPQYVPGRQSVQEEVVRERLPSPQEVHAVAPPGESETNGSAQSMQEVTPAVDALNFPAGQLLHAEPSQYLPAKLHAVQTVAPAAE